MEKRTILGYLVAAVGALCAVGWFPFRRWYLRWGATSVEVRRSMPGDGLVPRPRQTYTRAITILAAAADVWPWLAQMGQGRGGLYSYDRLENLFGLGVRSADRIVPELQRLAVGDTIRLAPEPGPAFTVQAVQPGRMLLLLARNDLETGQPFVRGAGLPSKYMNVSWAFVLEAHADEFTRVIVRQRLDYDPSFASRLMWHIMEPINFIMERKMLLTLKQRAESVARQDVE
ncbi:MAG TPA: hypothetical protein VMT24_12525 [Aggregatilineaceae bacterium]|nr:hypothetical protein [Aggregatilineaceae bacterium]